MSTHAEIRRVSPVSGQSIGIDSAPGRNLRTKLANRKLGTCTWARAASPDGPTRGEAGLVVS